MGRTKNIPSEKNKRSIYQDDGSIDSVWLPPVNVTAKGKRKRKYGLDKIDTLLDDFNKTYSLLGFTDKQYDPISNSWEESSEDWKKVQEIGSILSLPIGSINTKSKLFKQLSNFFPVGEGLKSLLKTSDKTGKFKSEIDWAKWNPETPTHKVLMDEYNAIEESTKKAGTWMKNPDGSLFQGTPEQFIQQQSSWFKKAFGDSKLVNPDGSPTIQYHGSAKKFDTFDESKFQLGDSGYSGRGIYTTPSKNKAESYALSSKSIHKDGNYEPTVYELYGQGNNPISSEDLIKQNKDYDLFNFHRAKDWRGDVPLEEQMLDYDVAIRNQTRGIEKVLPWNQATELVFPTNKQLKSAVGNVGFFDMTNPNIYKGLIPATIGSGAIMANNKNKNDMKKHKYGGKIKKYQQGEEILNQIFSNTGLNDLLLAQKENRLILPEKSVSSLFFNKNIPEVRQKVSKKDKKTENVLNAIVSAGILDQLKQNPLSKEDTLSYLNQANKLGAFSLSNVKAYKGIYDDFKSRTGLTKAQSKKVLDAVIKDKNPIARKAIEMTITPFLQMGGPLSNLPFGNIGKISKKLYPAQLNQLSDIMTQMQQGDRSDSYLDVLAGATQKPYAGFQPGGLVNTTGYTPGTPSMNNPINIIPSNNITMKNTPFPVMAIPNVGNPMLLQPGKNYKFGGASSVMEIPMKQDGGVIRPKGDPWEYKENPDGSFSTRKRGSSKWIEVREGKAYDAIFNKVFTPSRKDADSEYRWYLQDGLGIKPGSKEWYDQYNSPENREFYEVHIKPNYTTESTTSNTGIGIENIRDSVTGVGDYMGFEQAFKTGRASGQPTFQWRGKSYGTELKRNQLETINVPEPTVMNSGQLPNMVSDLIQRDINSISERIPSTDSDNKVFPRGELPRVNPKANQLYNWELAGLNPVHLNPLNTGNSMLNVSDFTPSANNPLQFVNPFTSPQDMALMNLGKAAQYVENPEEDEKSKKKQNSLYRYLADKFAMRAKEKFQFGGNIPEGPSSPAEGIQLVDNRDYPDDLMDLFDSETETTVGKFDPTSNACFDLNGNKIECPFNNMPKKPILSPEDIDAAIQKMNNPQPMNEGEPRSMPGLLPKSNKKGIGRKMPLGRMGEDYSPQEYQLGKMVNLKQINPMSMGSLNVANTSQNFFPALSMLPKFQMGGEVGAVEFSPIQTEKGEKLIWPTGDITDVKARKMHSNMKDDHITDMVPGNMGVYVASRHKPLSISRNEANIPLGVGKVEYDENMSTKNQPKEVNFLDVFGKKGKLTPAQIAEKIKKKYSLTERDDPFAHLANVENKESRLPYNEILMSLNDFKREQNEMRQFKKGGYIPQYGLGADVIAGLVSGLGNIGMGIAGMVTQKKLRKQSEKDADNYYNEATGFLNRGTNIGTAGVLGSALSQDPFVNRPNRTIQRTGIQSMLDKTPQYLRTATSNMINRPMSIMKDAAFRNSTNFGRSMANLQPAFGNVLNQQSQAALQYGNQDIGLRNNYLTNLANLDGTIAQEFANQQNQMRLNRNTIFGNLFGNLGNLGINHYNQQMGLKANQTNMRMSARGQQAVNTQNAIQNFTNGINMIDWAKIFKPGTPSSPTPSNTGGNEGGSNSWTPCPGGCWPDIKGNCPC